MRKRNAPPKDMSAIKWVEFWLQGRQGDGNNKCSFCNFGDHDPRDCWYLVPEKRPVYWKPFGGLWYYYLPKSDFKRQASTLPPAQSQPSKPRTDQDSEQSKMAAKTSEEASFNMDYSMGFMVVENQQGMQTRRLSFLQAMDDGCQIRPHLISCALRKLP
jgi:hypothetical protein